MRVVRPLAEKAIVEVDNIPFFTKNLSLCDKISVVLGPEGPILESIVERGGHSTYRIFLEEPSDDAERLLTLIKAEGCDWERTTFRGGDLYAIDIPPCVDIYGIYEILERGQREKTWLFEEGNVGHHLTGDVSPLIS